MGVFFLTKKAGKLRLSAWELNRYDVAILRQESLLEGSWLLWLFCHTLAS